ncbi:MAG: hypothetical protein JWO41_225 [Candidatus Saccharibacteria bacterium]|nr:hypothetical protein [Candidatus Saccharibacteria bacterium]
MLYSIPALESVGYTRYTTTEIDGSMVFSEPNEITGLFGELYVTSTLPWQWALYARSSGDMQDVSNYLLENRVNIDPEIAQAINKYFWDF